jgi:hypothetical protein
MFLRNVICAAGLASVATAAKLHRRVPCDGTTTTSATDTTSATTTASASPTTSSGASSSSANFEFFGVNESGPEFGQQHIPGVKNTDYVWPDLSTIDVSGNVSWRQYVKKLIVTRRSSMRA